MFKKFLGQSIVHVGGGAAAPPLADLIGRFETTSSGDFTVDASNNISQWNDLSGNNNHLTQTGANTLKPQLTTDSDGNLGVEFIKGRSGYLDIPSGIDVDARDCAIWVIASRTPDISGGGFDDQSYLIGFGVVAGDVGIQANHTGLDLDAFDGNKRASGINNQNITCLMGLNSDASSSDIHLNKQSAATAVQIDIDISNAGGRLGNHGSVTSLEWRGVIKAVLVYNVAQDALAIAQIKTWAQTTYGAGKTNTDQFAFHGDSLTSGTGVNINDSYPEQLWRLRAGNFDGINAAWPGIGVPQIITEGTADVDTFYDAATYTGKKVCVLWVGTNNLSIGQSAASILADLQTYASDRQTTGWQILVCTITPQSGITGAEETERTTLNSDIITNTGSWHDGSIDLAGNANLDDETDTTYYNGDQVHMTAAGYGVVASLVNAAINAL